MANDRVLDPNEVLEQLKAGAKSSRTQKSLDIVHQVCKEQHERGSPDFSYGMIGKLSGAIGGPQPQPIRNKSGEIYRRLIDVWARYAQGSTRKPAAPRAPALEDNLLKGIEDGAIKILVASIISQKKRLEYENQTLKMALKDSLVIDIRDKKKGSGEIEVVNPLDFLYPAEFDALRDAISPALMIKMGWTLNEKTGAISKGPIPVFKAGFATAIRKILEDAKN